MPVKGKKPAGGRSMTHGTAGVSRPGRGSKRRPSPSRDQNPQARGLLTPTRPVHRVASTTKKSVMLTYDAGTSREVSVAGDFNDWTPERMTKGTDGAWRLTVQLASGTHEYRFLVDGEWHEDPNNPRRKVNSMGGHNSIFAVL